MTAWDLVYPYLKSLDDQRRARDELRDATDRLREAERPLRRLLESEGCPVLIHRENYRRMAVMLDANADICVVEAEDSMAVRLPDSRPAVADAATDDAESLPPGWRATNCGYEHDSGDWVDATHMDARARAYGAGGKLVGRFATPLQAMQALDARRRDLDDDTAELDTRDIVAALNDACRAAAFARPEVP